MIGPYAMYFWLERSCVVFVLCAGVILTAMAEARSGEFHSKQSIGGNGHHIDDGGWLFHGNYCGPGNRPGTRPVDALGAAFLPYGACGRFNAAPRCTCNGRPQSSGTAGAAGPAQHEDIY